MVDSSKNRTVRIGHLYPKQMNVYGDMGNIITLRYRLGSRGYNVEYRPLDSAVNVSKQQIDILIGGGGQDSNQDIVQKDLLRGAAELKKLADEGTVMLMICGLYQLFGHHFIVDKDYVIEGVGVLDIETRAGEERLIGNVVVGSRWGRLVGFENHSGRTTLGPGVEPLGTVVKGAGNNGETKDEGAVYNNVFGSYLHGPALAKNPRFADELIKRALKNRGFTGELKPLDDGIEIMAAKLAAKRPR